MPQVIFHFHFGRLFSISRFLSFSKNISFLGQLFKVTIKDFIYLHKMNKTQF